MQSSKMYNHNIFRVKMHGGMQGNISFKQTRAVLADMKNVLRCSRCKVCTNEQKLVLLAGWIWILWKEHIIYDMDEKCL